MTTDIIFIYHSDIYSYLFATIAYTLLLLLSIWGIKRYHSGFVFFIAVLTSVIWSAYTSYALIHDELYSSDSIPLETLRNLAWFIYLLSMLARLEQAPEEEKNLDKKSILYYFNTFKITFLYPSSYSITLIVSSLCIFIIELKPDLMLNLNLIVGMDFRLLSHICFAIIGLMLIEQLYRNTLSEQRWAIKFMCLGLGSLFAYDFIIYSKSLLFATLDFTLWNSRGFVNALIVPLLAISVLRLQDTSTYTVSRKVIFHTTTLVGTGLYLIFMSMVGFYIKSYGGHWGDIAQTIFIFLALLLLIAVMFSGAIRAKFKNHFNKHFFHYRYDYRKEWLSLSKKLATLDSFSELPHLMIKTIVDLVDSSGGGLWVKNEAGDYYRSENYQFNLQDAQLDLISHKDHSLKFLKEKQWVIDIYEYMDEPEIYDQVNLEHWVKHKKTIWLLVPLLQQSELIAFIVLAKPQVSRQLNWEDHDMLKTVGMQLANAFALKITSDKLSTARQFEAYSRLSAFVIHDLKNLVAQVSLIVKNAEKHKANPEFIEDAIETLENVVKKMQKLVSQLRQRNIPNEYSQFDLVSLILDIIRQQSQQLPKPEFQSTIDHCMINGKQEQISAVLGHLVQNAQDATYDEGLVIVKLMSDKKWAIIKVIDRGCGMDEKFISERLFKPFDTTKGNAGMGIGVYEAKSYILKHSGSISVKSELNQGTEFTIQLPLLAESISL